MQTYECAECHAPITAKDGETEVIFVRTCKCKNAAVLANMEATVYGESAVE